jgi:uncharacterized protein (TIGR03083 family)
MSRRDMLHRNDLRFVGAAGTLTADDWSAPSLCDEWTNHDVLAHLVVGYGGGLGPMVAEMYRQGGSFDGANTALACTLAATRTPAELLDDFARLIDQPRGTGRLLPRRMMVGDHVTHELDILYALDRDPDVRADVVVGVLKTQVSLPSPFVPAFFNSRGLRLVATDVDWAHGEGPEVRGRATELVSVLGNRPKMLPRLSGDGVADLSSRVLSRRTRTAG